MRKLARFAITVREEDFVLHLVDEAGETEEFETSAEQLDRVIDALDDLLSEDDDDDEPLEGGVH
ncbi:MAG: hypothetical protein ABI655_13265 [Phenylobacterium sp.]